MTTMVKIKLSISAHWVREEWISWLVVGPVFEDSELGMVVFDKNRELWDAFAGRDKAQVAVGLSSRRKAEGALLKALKASRIH